MIAERPLTDGTIALLNLGAQIDAAGAGGQAWSRLGRNASGSRRIDPAARADSSAALPITSGRRRSPSSSCATRPTDARAFLARARTRASFHRFNDALADVDRAEQLSLDAETANGERAAIFQALGRYDEALALREEAAAAPGEL